MLVEKSFPRAKSRVSVGKNCLHLQIVRAILILACCMPTEFVFGLRCYTCSFTETEMDNECLLAPGNSVKVTNCTKKYCTITRQEVVSPAGKVISFVRDCQDKPLFLNAEKVDPKFKTFYRSCVTDLCNDSDGTHSATHIDPNFGASENTIIKGKSVAISTRKIQNSVLLLCVCVCVLIGLQPQPFLF